MHVLIYNVQGSCVRRLSLGPAVSNPMTFTWNGCSSGGARVAPGVYYLRAVVGQTAYRQKLVLIR
jgi:flagellar hook assembly protein FlgD